VTLTYLYCLVASKTAPRLRGVPEGAPGAGPARVVDAGRGLWLIVADANSAFLGEKAIAAGIGNLDWVSRRAMAHEAVIEHFLSARAVVPMQLFTIFTSDARALEYVRGARPRINRVVKRIADHHEWGLRVMWDEQSVRGARNTSSTTGPRTTGSAYLRGKRDLLSRSRVQLTAAKTAAGRLFRQLAKAATAANRHVRTEQAVPGSRLLLAAALLVRVSRAGTFRRALKAQMKTVDGRGLVVSLTGPWPPYNFVSPPRVASRQARTQ
jgi:hypothetical protein